MYSSDNYLNELKEKIVHLEIPLSRNLQHVQTSQMIFRANPLTGFDTTRASSERYFRASHN